MDIKYTSTRKNKKVSCVDSVLDGLSSDGGLYVPISIPKLDKSFEEMKNMNYQEVAKYVIGKYFTDFTTEEINNCVTKAYDEKFSKEEIVPLINFDKIGFLELYHGKTSAFKDMALSILPHFIVTSMEKSNLKNKILILTATSGDTGKAALEGFRDVEGTDIIVFYPEKGVSQVQERQMITQEGSNTFVVSIDGNFDDAQNGVKEAFNNYEFNSFMNGQGYQLSSANSINIGRLVPQIVYYVYGYLQLLKEEKVVVGEEINVVVPTGNFGNILAAYYAREMGIPIDRLICASNENNVLYDFFKTGVYDKNRELKLTISPSMDILISSNLERLLYEISGKNPELISNMMTELSDKGKYEVNDEMKKKLELFYGGYAKEEEVLETIKTFFNEKGYLMDTHTAVAYNVYEKYKKDTGDNKQTIIVSTASPFKFTRSVAESIGIDVNNKTDFELIGELSKKAKVYIPNNLKDIEKLPIKHNISCEKESMKEIIEKVLNVGE